MNSDPNSDCKPCIESKLGWVHSVHTQQPRSRAHCACSAQVVGAVAGTTSRSCAHARVVARAAAPASIATQSLGRDTQFQQARSRPQIDVATSLWSSHRNAPVATQTTTRQPEPCLYIKSVSRHHSGHSRSRPRNGVATPFLLPSPKPGRNTKTRSRPFWRLTYVATSISCRDLVSAHSGISKSRR